MIELGSSLIKIKLSIITKFFYKSDVDLDQQNY